MTLSKHLWLWAWWNRTDFTQNSLSFYSKPLPLSVFISSLLKSNLFQFISLFQTSFNFSRIARYSMWFVPLLSCFSYCYEKCLGHGETLWKLLSTKTVYTVALLSLTFLSCMCVSVCMSLWSKALEKLALKKS